MITLFKKNSSKRYLFNFGWLLFEKVFRMGLVFLITAYIARYLGPREFGMISYAQSFVTLFAAFASLGVDQIVTREIIAKKYDQNELLGSCFFLKVIGSVVVIILALITSIFSNDDSVTTLIIALVALGTFFQASTTITVYFQAIVNSKAISIAQMIALIISSVLKLVLVYVNAELIWFGIALLLDSVFTAMLLITAYLKREGSIFLWRFNKKIACSLLNESWPLIISSAVIAVYTRIDQVMLKYMLDETAVGIYAVAVRISEATGFLPAVLISSFFPAVASAKKKGEKEYKTATLRFFSLITYSGLMLAVLVSVLASWFVPLVFGEAYSLSSQVLVVHMWGIFFSFIGAACTQWLILEKLTKYRLYRTIAGVLINIVLNWLLIPQYGVLGAAYATLVSQVIASYFGNLFSRKTLTVFVLQTKSLLPIKN